MKKGKSAAASSSAAPKKASGAAAAAGGVKAVASDVETAFLNMSL